VNQYKIVSSILIYSCLGLFCLVVFVYNKLSSNYIQPLPFLESIVPTGSLLTDVVSYRKITRFFKCATELKEVEQISIFV